MSQFNADQKAESLDPSIQKLDPQQMSDSDEEPIVGFKKYKMYYTLSRTNVRLKLGSSTGPSVYYLKSKFLTKASIQLYAGDSDSGPMLAFAGSHRDLQSAMFGFGDYNDKASGTVVTEELRRDKNILHRSDWTFELTNESGARVPYTWKKDKARHGKTIYQCVDAEGCMVSKMLSGGMLNFSKGGEIDLPDDMDKELEIKILISGLAIWVMEAHRSFMQGYDSSGAQPQSSEASKAP